MYVKRCDKNVDCHDKSDEQNCNYRQPHDEVNSHQKYKYEYNHNYKYRHKYKYKLIISNHFLRTTSARWMVGRTVCSSQRRRSATGTTTAETSLTKRAARECLVR